eukprot:jgi/Bigna1/53702/estExt_Genewise1Plus.C_230052
MRRGEASETAAGVRPTPKLKLSEGETFQIPDSEYEIRLRGGVHYCTCPAWRYYGGAVDTRTCKHLQAHLGEEYMQFVQKGCLRGVGQGEGGGGKGGGAKVTKKAGGMRGVLLAKKWKGENVSGWWMSEKLDGIRAYWDGSQFLSRNGNKFHAPSWFTEGLPTDLHLDGELFGGRNEFQATSGIVKSFAAGERWKKLTYEVFDAPSLDLPFEKRLERVKTQAEKKLNAYIRVVQHTLCEGKEHVETELDKLTKDGAEGLMLRKPGSKYVRSRSTTLLKVKTFQDCEAVVVGYNKGKGKYDGQAGSLDARLDNGIQFNVGSGMSDEQRRNPPPIGSIITVKFFEYTKDGKPRFPTFVGVRVDADKSKFAKWLVDADD